MSESQIPDCWISTTFTEVLDVQGGTQPPKSEFLYEPAKGYVRLLQIRDFGERPVPTYIPDSTKLKKCEIQDVLVGRYGASLGRICTGMTGAYNVALAKIVKPESVDLKFVKHFLNSEHFQFALQLLSRSAQNGFNKEDLATFDFFLPPLAEQKEIARKLDELLAQVNSIKTRLDAIPNILKRFRQSVLAAAVGGRLTEEWRGQLNLNKFNLEVGELAVFRDQELEPLPENWQWLKFEYVADIASNLQSPLEDPKAIHIAPNHIESGSGKLLEFKTVEEDNVTSAKHRFYSGQILYSKIRPYLCKVAIAKFTGLCSADMYPVNPKIETNYLFRWMLSSRFTDWASNAESRSVLPKINQNDLNKIPVPTPPLEEQTEIVRRVEQLFTYADQIEQRVKDAQARVNYLTQSILAKAFRGELTAEWRAQNVELISGENSAAALLEKIKAERESLSKGKKKKA